MMATFSSSDKDFDPMIESKVTTDEAKSHILNLALAGAKRLIRDGRFIEPESVVKMLERYKIDNTISLQYIEDSGIDENHCLTTPIRDLYMEFTEWCESSGVNPVSARLFYKDIQKYFGFANEKKRTDGGKKRYFMMDLEV
jgi:putative DNA primase/helicase